MRWEGGGEWQRGGGRGRGRGSGGREKEGNGEGVTARAIGKRQEGRMAGHSLASSVAVDQWVGSVGVGWGEEQLRAKGGSMSTAGASAAMGAGVAQMVAVAMRAQRRLVWASGPARLSSPGGRCGGQWHRHRPGHSRGSSSALEIESSRAGAGAGWRVVVVHGGREVRLGGGCSGVTSVLLGWCWMRRGRRGAHVFQEDGGGSDNDDDDGKDNAQEQEQAQAQEQAQEAEDAGAAGMRDRSQGLAGEEEQRARDGSRWCCSRMNECVPCMDGREQ
ncbi:hypothetical protein J1614_002418 [Plenodomus biglobosus]|nr:hypothetical protein J1614_002418 [Plenodomus biglobosus]